jgi:hypothetical protein
VWQVLDHEATGAPRLIGQVEASADTLGGWREELVARTEELKGFIGMDGWRARCRGDNPHYCHAVSHSEPF